jgi:hypothetical protein
MAVFDVTVLRDNLLVGERCRSILYTWWNPLLLAVESEVGSDPVGLTVLESTDRMVLMIVERDYGEGERRMRSPFMEPFDDVLES